MKEVWISLCIAAVMIGGSVCYTNHMDKVSHELGTINKQVMENLENEKYDTAYAKAEELAKYLDDKRAILAATGNHEELDKIEMNISEMTGYIYGERKIDAISKCNVLDFLFSHLPVNYKLKIENIL